MRTVGVDIEIAAFLLQTWYAGKSKHSLRPWFLPKLRSFIDCIKEKLWIQIDMKEIIILIHYMMHTQRGFRLEQLSNVDCLVLLYMETTVYIKGSIFVVG